MQNMNDAIEDWLEECRDGDSEERVSRLGSHGLIAAMFDELGIAKAIDEVVPWHEKSEISLGNLVKAFTLNGLNIKARPIFRIADNFAEQDLYQLFEPDSGVCYEKLNDDRFGRCLDALHEFGVSPLFGLVVAQANQKLGIKAHFGNLDYTSFAVDGEYSRYASELLQEELTAIQPARGYSRDHRPDLKQINLALMTDSLNGIPFFMKPLSGNTSDSWATQEILKGFKENLTTPHQIQGVIADAAMGTRESLQTLHTENIPFITRAPQTFSEVKQGITRAKEDFLRQTHAGTASEESANTIPQIFTHETTFELPIPKEEGSDEPESILLRMVVVRSQAHAERKEKSFAKKLQKLRDEDQKKIRKLKRQLFHCDEDAKVAITALEADLKVLSTASLDVDFQAVYDSKGRPAKGDNPDWYKIYIIGDTPECPQKISRLRLYEGWFCLLTNVHEEQMDADELFAAYKSQNKVERGFRFLKSPHFLLPAIYLKKPSRIESLMFLMSLCLLVYSALEKTIRDVLGDYKEAFFPEKGRPNRKTRRPTVEYILEEMVFISLQKNADHEWVVAGIPAHIKKMLALLGPAFVRNYIPKPELNST